MKIKSVRTYIALVGILLTTSVYLEAASSPSPADHSCQPVGDAPDECSNWNSDSCSWVSSCDEGLSCCGGSCTKIDDCNVCCGGASLDVCTTGTVSLSLSADGFDKVVKLLKAAPMVKDASVSLSVEGGVDGKNCCKDDAPKKVYSGTGSFTAAVGVELNIPGWAGEFSREWEGIYYLYGEYFAGPIVGVTASGSGSVSYEKDECAGTECKKGTGTIEANLSLTLGGRAEVLVEVFRGTIFEVFQHVEAELSGTGSGGVSASSGWSSGDCEDSAPGKVCWGAITASGQFTGGIVGVGGFSVSVERELFEGGCK